MKQLFTIAISTILLSLFITPSFAVETSVSDLVGTDTATTTATPTAQVTATNALGLDIPAQTDNPSTIITFINPSKDGAIIQLEVDSKGFADITSPYTFPALSIGKHTLEFKYQDENAATQIYDSSIIIIPRAPILGTPSVSADKVTISGTGLANSEIILLLSSGSTVLTQTTTIDGDGRWVIDFAKADLSKDIYSLNAYTRRYGYASNLSETTKFTLDDQITTLSKNTPFNIKSITLDAVKTWGITNQYYLITAISALLIGIMIGVVSISQMKHKDERKAEKKVAEKFVKAEPKEKEVTLREKLMGVERTAETKPEQQTTNKEKVDTKKEEPAVINKIDFLKDFKNFDPDNSKGEEVKSPVVVSLTSKK